MIPLPGIRYDIRFLKLPVASPPAILIGGTFGGECARCFGSFNRRPFYLEFDLLSPLSPFMFDIDCGAARHCNPVPGRAETDRHKILPQFGIPEVYPEGRPRKGGIRPVS